MVFGCPVGPDGTSSARIALDGHLAAVSPSHSRASAGSALQPGVKILLELMRAGLRRSVGSSVGPITTELPHPSVMDCVDDQAGADIRASPIRILGRGEPDYQSRLGIA